MANLIKMTIQLRRDTTANWDLYKDTVPAQGEPCFDYELGTLKIGDGIKTYAELTPIGGDGGVSISADGKSIVLDDGTFKLAGFDAAVTGAQPRKTAEGGIEWVIPTNEEIEELKTAIEEAQLDVAGLKESMTEVQEIVMPTTEGGSTLLDRVVGLEFKMDETGEGTVDAKIDAKINEFATRVSDDGTINTIQELFNYVANHGGEISTILSDIAALQAKVGSETVQEQITNAIANSGHISKVEAKATLQQVKYEVCCKPTGTLVDYNDKEIRIMIPADTDFTTQKNAVDGVSNMFYVENRIYAPDDAIRYRVNFGGTVTEGAVEDFAGLTDDYGRIYLMVPLPVAYYDTTSSVWVYYGANSTTNHYIGWDQIVDWYDADGVMIGSDCIRINLSNEDCYSVVESYYMGNVVKEVNLGGTVLDIVNNGVTIPIGAGLVASKEVTIDALGNLGIGEISVSKLVQEGDVELTLDGGSAF